MSNGRINYELIFDQKLEFELLLRNRNFSQTSKIWSKIENLVKNGKFSQKIRILIKNRKFCQKSEF